METLAINGLIGVVCLLFAAMAVFPMLVESKPARKTPILLEDDQVISIQPVAPTAPAIRPVAHIGDEPVPTHRHAA
jgi:hypothetical protein